jgi:hypothetical protein
MANYYPTHDGAKQCHFCEAPIESSRSIKYHGVCSKHSAFLPASLQQMIFEYYQEEFAKLSLPHTTMHQLTIKCEFCQEQKTIEHPHIDFIKPASNFVKRHKECKR